MARSGGKLSLLKWDRTVALHHTDNVLSYAMARMKSDPLYRYRPPDVRAYFYVTHIATEADLRASLAPGGRWHELVIEGGAWSDHVRRAVALRDGDAATVAACDAAAAEREAKILQAPECGPCDKCFPSNGVSGVETLRPAAYPPAKAASLPIDEFAGLSPDGGASR